MHEKLIREIMQRMSPELTREQMQSLESVLVITLHQYHIEEAGRELIISENGWERILRTFLATKRLENCSNGTLEQYSRAVRIMMGTIGKRIQDITTNDIRFYLADYQARRGVSISYVDTIRHYLGSFFGWASDEGYIAKNPMKRIPKIKVPKKKRKAYTAEEREILRCHAQTERDLALMEVLYCTAARVSEIVSLNRSDVDFSGRAVVIYSHKNKKERIGYLTESASYHLRQYLAGRTDQNPALFVAHRAPYRRLGKSGIEAMLREVGKRTGIHAYPHRYRGSFITDACVRGWGLDEVQDYVGHADPKTTNIYRNKKELSIRAKFDRLIA